MLSRNTTIQWIRTVKCEKDNKERKRTCAHRLLAFSDDGTKTAAVNLDSGEKRLRIEIYEIPEIEKKLADGVAEILKMAREPRSETEAVLKYREEARSILEPFFNRTDYLFKGVVRADLIKLAAKITESSPKVVRDRLGRYLKAGLQMAGVFPDWGNCGGIPTGGRRLKQGVRLGRPNSLASITHLLTGRFPLTDQDKGKFDQGIAKHVRGAANKNNSWPVRFSRTLFDFFRQDVDRGDGTTAKEFEPNLPTQQQFKSYVLSKFTPQELRESGQSPAEHGTSDREQMSENTTLRPRGPGDIYQIDSTSCDIYLIRSDGTRRLIGRPTIYIVIDVFSHLIVGFHLTLRPPCYDEMIVALLSCLEDKRMLCQRWGVAFREDEWLDTPLCNQLVADRQECIYHNSDLLSGLGITLINAPPNRGDFKGLVEGIFAVISSELSRRPGHVDKKHPKDQPNYRNDAIYHFREIGKLLLQDVIKLNRRFLPNIPVPQEFVLHDQDKTPLNIYRWGLQYLSGGGFTLDLDTARQELLPMVETARTSRRGIAISTKDVHGLLYIPPDGAFPEDFFKGKAGIPLKAQYNSALVDIVWVRHPETGVSIACHLDTVDCREYLGMSWSQAAFWQNRLKHQGVRIGEANLNRNAELFDEEAKLAEEARRRALSQGPKTRISLAQGQSVHRAEQHQENVAGDDSLQQPESGTIDSSATQLSSDQEKESVGVVPLDEDER